MAEQMTNSAYRRVLPHGLWQAPRDRQVGLCGRAFVAIRGVPELGVLAGDTLVVLFASGPITQRERGSVAGNVIPLPRSKYGQLLDNWDAFEFVDHSWPFWRESPAQRVDRAYADARRKVQHIFRAWGSAGRSWNDATSPVLVLRPWRSATSSPIRATSDAAALFELIRDAGGRMPEGGDDA